MLIAFALAGLLAQKPDEVGIRPVGVDGHVLNLDFETGDLRDWTATGDAFANQPIEGDAVHARRGDMFSKHQGKFWLGTFERSGDAARGTLESAPFVVTHTFASFLVGGGTSGETCVQIIAVDTNRVVFQASGDGVEDMQRVLVDLFALRGKKVYIRIVDNATGGWGHINFDDFRFHDRRPNFPVRKAAKLDVYEHNGLDPEAAAKAMTVPPGFEVKLFAGEPDIRQPIAMTIDDRGRLWVAENYTYPARPKVPIFMKDPAAPIPLKGKDRILLFEDTNGDGKFDKRTEVASGFDHITGLEYGFGGLWIGAAPYLLYLPLDAKTDKPAGPPKVLLDGWGYEDTHETLNSFIWGPDGWLYGCHGVFTYAFVGKPGTPREQRTKLTCGIWRYHPTEHRFDVYAHGTSNPWGVDFNGNGDCFLTCCVIPHLFHIIPGARYDRQAGSHYNPFTYDDIQTIAKHRHWVGSTPHSGNGRSDEAGGGHAHAGCMFYQGGLWPAEYNGKLFMNNIHGARLNVDAITPKGSGYSGDRSPDFLKANDSWSQILYLRSGPDGNVYFIDWYDRQQCHLADPAKHDRTNGRVFKVSYTGKPASTSAGAAAAAEKKFAESKDLRLMSDAELASLTESVNQWFVRQSRRILRERAAASKVDPAVVAELVASAKKTGPYALEYLWTAAAAGGASREFLTAMLDHSSEHVRGCTWRLAAQMSDGGSLPGVDRASKESSPVVRLAIASAVERADSSSKWAAMPGLISHAEDSADHNLPLMYWYAAEPLGAEDPAKALDLVCGGKIPLLVNFMSRRIAASNDAAALGVLVKGLNVHTDPATQLEILRGASFTLQSQRRVAMPAEWPQTFKSLVRSANAEIRSLATSLAVKFGDPAALATMRELVADKSATTGQRKAALASLLSFRDADLPPVLQRLLSDVEMRKASLQGLGAFGDPKTPAAIFGVFSSLSVEEKRDALNALAGREAYALALLDALNSNSIPRGEVSADVIRQLANLRSPAVDKRIADVWGTVRQTSADKAKQIAAFKKLLLRAPKETPDVSLGRAVFAKTCQQCHKLFDAGNNTAPELTGSNRASLDYVLANVVDPNAVIGKDYLAHRIQLTDGRVLTAIIRKDDGKAFTVVTANETLVLPKADIEQMAVTTQSLMPEGLLDKLSEHELRSLVKYLASPQQVALPPGFVAPAAGK